MLTLYVALPGIFHVAVHYLPTEDLMNQLPTSMYQVVVILNRCLQRLSIH